MRTMGPVAFVVLVFVDGLGVAADPPAKAEPAKDVELTVTAGAAKTTLLKDGSNAEPVELTIAFKNVSGKELKLDTGDIEAQRLGSLWLEVVGPDNKPVAAEVVSTGPPGKQLPPRAVVQTIAADKSWETKVTVPGVWARRLGSETKYVFTRPGTYRIKVVFDGSGGAKETWQGTATSKEIEIKVEEAGK